MAHIKDAQKCVRESLNKAKKTQTLFSTEAIHVWLN